MISNNKVLFELKGPFRGLPKTKTWSSKERVANRREAREARGKRHVSKVSTHNIHGEKISRQLSQFIPGSVISKMTLVDSISRKAKSTDNPKAKKALSKTAKKMFNNLRMAENIEV